MSNVPIPSEAIIDAGLQTSDIHPPELTSNRAKAVTAIFVIAPFLGLIAAVILMWGRGFSLLYLVLMAAMYIVTALGITVGYHRLFTHRSFETSRWVKAMFAIMGSMAIEGPMLRWVANHRRHHQHSDHEEDPHSPTIMVMGSWAPLPGSITPTSVGLPTKNRLIFRVTLVTWCAIACFG